MLEWVILTLHFFHNNYNNTSPGPFLYKMKNKPMGLISTPFISYHDIKVNDLDLLEDSWGLTAEFSDVIDILELLKPVPGKRLSKRLIDEIRKHE